MSDEPKENGPASGPPPGAPVSAPAGDRPARPPARDSRDGRDTRGRDGRDSRDSRDGRDRRPKRRFGGRGRRKVCRFCADKTLPLDYKWSEVLEDFISERGRIVPSRTSGTCAKHQRRLKIAIKQARSVALLRYSRS
ncbi:MAG: 30S ribosomal protein S18 [Myxococcales bacterium]|jgi:small subunit ribosomal protein S18|nr:MAG: 30S ribosomal protein S18 [Myxococcales bacterium]